MPYFSLISSICLSCSTSSVIDLRKLWFCVLLGRFLLQAMDITFFYILNRSNFQRIRLSLSSQIIFVMELEDTVVMFVEELPHSY